MRVSKILLHAQIRAKSSRGLGEVSKHMLLDGRTAVSQTLPKLVVDGVGLESHQVIVASRTRMFRGERKFATTEYFHD
jgi:hypothetical protein